MLEDDFITLSDEDELLFENYFGALSVDPSVEVDFDMEETALFNAVFGEPHPQEPCVNLTDEGEMLFNNYFGTVFKQEVLFGWPVKYYDPLKMDKSFLNYALNWKLREIAKPLKKAATPPITAKNLNGEAVIANLFDALYHYAYGEEERAVVADSIVAESIETAKYAEKFEDMKKKLQEVPRTKNEGNLSYKDHFPWNQGFVLGSNTMYMAFNINWKASGWSKSGTARRRTVNGHGSILLYTTDKWDFVPHEKDSAWETLKKETGPEIIAEIFSIIFSGRLGKAFPLHGAYRIGNIETTVVQYAQNT
jgi:hypothetical protein